jgi:hypothetical protein
MVTATRVPRIRKRAVDALIRTEQTLWRLHYQRIMRDLQEGSPARVMMNETLEWAEEVLRTMVVARPSPHNAGCAIVRVALKIRALCDRVTEWDLPDARIALNEAANLVSAVLDDLQD